MELNQRLDHVDMFQNWNVGQPQVATDEDYALCRRVMRAASKNYSFASRFFSPEQLRHVEALYALLRVGDDRVDVSHAGFRTPLEAIEDWENTYWSAFHHGHSDHPVMRAYLNTAIERGIPADTMSAYFRAMKEDLVCTRFQTFDDLMHYMDGSAVPVGRAMTHILGVRPPHRLEDALPRADALSVAMQLSNFWRDIGYDWSINRVYLPQEDLERFGYREDDIAHSRVDDRLIALLEYQFERTESFYRLARQGTPMLASGRWAVQSGLEVYRAILDGIRRNGYNVFDHRAGSTRLQKVGLAFKAWLAVSWSG